MRILLSQAIETAKTFSLLKNTFKILLIIITFPSIVLHLNADQRLEIIPKFSIWDIEIGSHISTLPNLDLNDISCGTNGGPISTKLNNFKDYKRCKKEPNGLYEVSFSYDDERQYIIKALNMSSRALTDITTVYSHPVILSVLISEQSLITGIRIMTDERANVRQRRVAATLARNFNSRFKKWNLVCEDLPLTGGEMNIGSFNIKSRCFGKSPDGTKNLRMDARYLRKKGQIAVNPETQKINTTYFESFTRLEILRAPLTPNGPLVSKGRK